MLYSVVCALPKGVCSENKDGTVCSGCTSWQVQEFRPLLGNVCCSRIQDRVSFSATALAVELPCICGGCLKIRPHNSLDRIQPRLLAAITILAVL